VPSGADLGGSAIFDLSECDDECHGYAVPLVAPHTQDSFSNEARPAALAVPGIPPRLQSRSGCRTSRLLDVKNASVKDRATERVDGRAWPLVARSCAR
jgi:hypothetical protein